MPKEPSLKEQIKDLRENHISTLEKKVAVLDTKVKILLFLNVGIAIAVVAEVILGRL